MPRLLSAAALVVAAAASAPASSLAANDRILVPVSGDGGASANIVGSSPDGSRVYFATGDSLTPDDTDGGAGDVYERRGASLRLMSGPGAGAGDGADGANIVIRGFTPDGGLVYETDSSMTSTDVEVFPANDLFLSTPTGVRLVSRRTRSGFDGPPFPELQQFVRVSADGSTIVFSTDERLLQADSDNAIDTYVDRNGTLTMAATTGADNTPTAVSADGSVVAFTTAGQLTAGDSDAENDVYLYETGAPTLATPGTAGEFFFDALSLDGQHVIFESPEALVAADTDGGEQDVYEFTAGSVRLASTGPTDPHGPVTSGFQDVSADGDRIAFTTVASLVAGDSDASAEDIYLRDDGATTVLGSTGPNPRGRDSFFFFGDLSADGDLYWSFGEDLVDEDTDGFWKDSYRRTDTGTTLLSVSENEQTANASYAGHARTGGRTFFSTAGKFTTDDEDIHEDLYERTSGGDTVLISKGDEPCTLIPASVLCAPVWKGNNADGTRAWMETDEPLRTALDHDDTTDVYESRVTDPPVVVAPAGALSLGEEDSATAALTGITVTDPYDDVFGATVQVVDGAGKDVLDLPSPPDGITVGVEDDGATLRLSGRAPAATYATALAGVTYRNTDDNPAATRDIEVVVQGTGESLTADRAVTVTPVNDLPVLARATSTAAGYTEGAAPAVVADALTLTDPDDATATGATVTVSAGYVAGADILEPGPLPPGVTAMRTGATLRLTGSATLAEYRDALRAVTFRVAGDDPSAVARTVTFAADDATGAGAAEPVTVNVVPVNDPPTIAVDGADLTVAPGTASTVDPGLSLDDVDDTSLVGATVTVTSGLTAGDVLGAGDVDPAITATTGAGILTLSGRAPVAAYRAALRGVTFTAGGTPDTTRTLSLTAADDDGNGSAATRPVVVGGPLGPPTLTPLPALTRDRSPVATFTLTGGTGARCAVDAGAAVPCTSPLTLGPLTDGPHTLTVRQTRGAVTSPAATSSFVVDATAPAAPAVIGRPAARTAARTAEIAVVGEPGGAFRCAVDGAAAVPCGATVRLDGLELGTHTITIDQEDAAGNRGAGSTVSWEVVADPSATGGTGVPRGLSLVLGPEPRLRGRALPVGCTPRGTAITACTVRLTRERPDGAPVTLGRGTRTVATAVGSLAVRVLVGPTNLRRLRAAGRRPQVRLVATARTPAGDVTTIRRVRVVVPR